MNDFALTDRIDARNAIATLLLDALCGPAAARGIEGDTLGYLCEAIAHAAIPEPPETPAEPSEEVQPVE